MLAYGINVEYFFVGIVVFKPFQSLLSVPSNVRVLLAHTISLVTCYYCNTWYPTTGFRSGRKSYLHEGEADKIKADPEISQNAARPVLYKITKIIWKCVEDSLVYVLSSTLLLGSG